MTRIEIIRQTENLNELIEAGLIPIHIVDWVKIYNHYQEQRLKVGKMQAYTNTAEDFNLSERQIMNVVKFLEM